MSVAPQTSTSQFVPMPPPGQLPQAARAPVQPTFGSPLSRSTMPLVAPPPPVTSYLTPYPMAPVSAPVTQTTQVMVPAAYAPMPPVSPHAAMVEAPRPGWMRVGILALLVVGGATIYYVTTKKG